MDSRFGNVGEGDNKGSPIPDVGVAPSEGKSAPPIIDASRFTALVCGGKGLGGALKLRLETSVVLSSAIAVSRSPSGWMFRAFRKMYFIVTGMDKHLEG